MLRENENIVGLSKEKQNILLSIMRLLVLNDIDCEYTFLLRHKAKKMKRNWLLKWQQDVLSEYKEIHGADARIEWLNRKDVSAIFKEEKMDTPWVKTILLEAMLFRPYFPYKKELNDKGVDISAKKHKSLQRRVLAYREGRADRYLANLFSDENVSRCFIESIRKYQQTFDGKNTRLEVFFEELNIETGFLREIMLPLLIVVAFSITGLFKLISVFEIQMSLLYCVLFTLIGYRYGIPSFNEKVCSKIRERDEKFRMKYRENA
ncbi:MAG: hypothetical protein MJ105_06685 [Lachnospiraceae bacterium]|nr:hypothetical protein [Lachnospiraceae bacterium]